MKINEMLDKIKMKYLKDREFKKEFDKDKEKAIEKYFSKSFLKNIKNNLSEKSIQSFLNSKNRKEELDDNTLEAIAGGKEDKRDVTINTVVIEDKYKKNNFGLEINNARTGGNFNIQDNTQIFKV